MRARDAIVSVCLFISVNGQGSAEGFDSALASSIGSFSSVTNGSSITSDITSSSSSSSLGSSSNSGSFVSSSSSSSDDSGSSAAEDDTRMHPAHDEYNECQYVGDWGDCDPFKMIRVKEERLVIGGVQCEARKNITKPCSRDDFPPGTVWLLKEHKLCVLELEKLKSMIEDLHRYIDLIHQRGQSLYNAYNELRKRLMDVRREITIIGQHNHDTEQTIKRLRAEVEEWRSKSGKMQMELNQLKAQYKGMEMKVRTSKQKSEELAARKEEISGEQSRLNLKLGELNARNRNLKTSLLDAERYREELRVLQDEIAVLTQKIEKSRADLDKAKEDLRQARLQGAMPQSKTKGPKFNKDTKVNLDMSMWITHNVTQEEQQETYEPIIRYGEEPKYEEPKYEEPKYEEPKYEEPKYEEPKYEEPKYEEPKYEEPIEEPKYEEPKYEEPKYEEPKYEEPKYEEPKYEEPIEELKYEEPKFEEPEEMKY